jgi:DNA-binding Xre family transcriptional regulator
VAVAKQDMNLSLKHGVVRSRLKELMAIKEREVGHIIQQKDIAEAIGVAEPTIGRWMRPTPFERIETEVVIKLCAYLNCALGDLLFIDKDHR